MGVIHVKKKKGTSFLEIIIALSIIGIISVAVFNNIAFSLNVNKKTDEKQNSSILAQHVFEEIKNMGDSTFENFVKSMVEEPITADSSSSFLGSEFDDIDKLNDIGVGRAAFQKDEEKINSFKVFNKKGTELYVKILLPKLNVNDQEVKLGNEYAVTVADKPVQEWRIMEQCQVVIKITKQKQMDDYYVRLYKDGNSYDIFQGTKEQLIPKISLETSIKGDYIIGYFMNKEIYSKPIIEKLTEVNMYIEDNTEEDFSYILSNNGSIWLNLYVDQLISGKSDFITYGSNIRVYSNENGNTQVAENIVTESICDFVVEVYKKDKDNKMIEIKGHKKIKRIEL